MKKRVAAGDAPCVAPGAVYATPASFVPEVPRWRELRGYALDPSFATVLSTRTVSETVFRVPWNDTAPGPVDEYVEVMDVDPASACVYEPVNLDHPYLLASKGLAPSEGTPQFHQQMVYAVSRMTIKRFETALGRPALWRPGPPIDASKNIFDDSVFVRRLRIYPHALREANAFYSPVKIALLFGYFGSEPDGEGAIGERVFTCLSHDIIAHETTHALLDGMHRRYLTDSNPDVLAFHEAFADIVALFQRVALPDLLRFQIALTQGQVRTRRSLLGQLATQFGRAIGHRGALREAIGQMSAQGEWVAGEPSTSDYSAASEPHARGSVLVGAVFDAFISIYEKRSEDLLRIATDGTGVLPPGAIHPDLVNRLADEASKAAGHVLTMCIRALDYCPPTDLTFGEYLRAIVTADYELVPDDSRGYRVAFVEAFKKRGITVGGAPSMSVESVLWRPAHEARSGLSPGLLSILDAVRAAASAETAAADRRDVFERQRKVRRALHESLRSHFRTCVDQGDAVLLGLDPSMPFEVHSARYSTRAGPEGRLQSQAILGFLQRDSTQKVGTEFFEGGSTVVVDLASRNIRYVIRKNIQSPSRLAEQRRYSSGLAARGGGTYFRASDADEPFAGLHQRSGEA